MKKYAALITSIVAALFVSGCASFKTPMRNAEGHVISCNSSGMGWLGVPVAYFSQRSCEKEHRERGYVAFEDVAPPNIAKYETKASDQNKDPAPISGEIEKLHEMKKVGALTEEEFTVAKQRLLSR